MANIRGFRDLNNANNNNNRNQGNPQGYNIDQQAEVPLLFSYPALNKPAREESLWDMSKYGCCPTFKISQFLVLITLFEYAVFIMTLCFGLDTSNEFLSPTNQTLYNFGGKYPYSMIHGAQIWRFITPTFLHANLLHILSNSVFQLAYGCRLETCVGRNKMILIYFVSGIGGILFSSLISDDLSVGASTSIFGILGAYLGYIWLNWDAMRPLGPIRYTFLCMIIFIVLINVFIGLDMSSNVDNWGHLGGFFTGLLFSVPIFTPIMVQQDTKKFQIVMGTLCAIYFLVGFLCFFLVRDPQDSFRLSFKF